eukprot:m.136250 g.136250  ORF g.136250 m.136250 type:complete len:216 (-) comp52470_c0_seq7:637-1284(-)
MISSRSVSWLVGRGDLQAPAQIAVFQGAQTGVLFCCRMCAVPFSAGPFKYQRVLELPEENWQELASSMACHGEFSHLVEADLTPRATDLLVGEATCHINVSTLSDTALFNKPPTVTKFAYLTTEAFCRRCRTPVGLLQFKEGVAVAVAFQKSAVIALVTDNHDVFGDQKITFNLLAEVASHFRHQSCQRLVVVSRSVCSFVACRYCSWCGVCDCW